MGCVHTHKGRPIIERCGSLNHVRRIVEKIGMIVERLGRSIEPLVKCLPQGWNMINFEHDGL